MRKSTFMDYNKVQKPFLASSRTSGWRWTRSCFPPRRLATPGVSAGRWLPRSPGWCPPARWRCSAELSSADLTSFDRLANTDALLKDHECMKNFFQKKKLNLRATTTRNFGLFPLERFTTNHKYKQLREPLPSQTLPVIQTHDLLTFIFFSGHCLLRLILLLHLASTQGA